MTTSVATVPISTRFYLASIPAGPLDHLRSTAVYLMESAEGFGPPRADRLGKWLYSQINAELARRAADPPIEAMPVGVPVLDWTDAEVADALQWLTHLSYATRRDGTDEFIDKLAQFFTTIAAYRLRQRGNR